MLSTIETKTEAEFLFADLDKPSLHALSYVLRHPETWPKDFVWDYDSCRQCAMGMAHQLWSSIPQANTTNACSLMARSFAMPYSEAKRIFMNSPMAWWGLRTVTPEMVADKIDSYLARAE